MAGSSNGKGIIVEPTGEQRSFWASTVEHTLRIMREELDVKAPIGLRILKVPEYQRQPTAEFSPAQWRFGLHNRDEKQTDMSESEAAKRAIVVLFGLDEQSKWMSFCDAVVPDPKAMLKRYGLHKEVNGLLEDEIKQVLAFDALFLAVNMERFKSMDEIRRLIIPERYIMSSQMWDYYEHTFVRCYRLVRRDLCKIENQIPFDLIKRAIEHVQNLAIPGQVNGDRTVRRFGAVAEQVPDSYVQMWMKTAVQDAMLSFMDVSNGFYEGENAKERLLGSYHILDAAYKVVCGEDGMKRRSDPDQNDYIHVPSATKLKESGIQIEGVAGPLCRMSYDTKKKCLSLPKMQIRDSTMSLVRNMARYEEYSWPFEPHCMFHDYIILMVNLIKTPSDLDHLIKCRVVDNGCGNRAVELWQALDQGFILMDSSEEHNKMKRNIKNRCKLRRHRFWSEFKILFLSRPWLTLSAIAVILVTVATLIQTYVAVISSNRMEPQFKP